MAFSVTINYGSGDVSLTNYSGENLVYNSTFRKSETVHNKEFRAVTSQAYFSFEPKPALMSTLFALDREQNISITILDGATPWFKGYVRPLTKFKDSTGKKSVDVECVDVGWLLHVKPTGGVAWTPSDSMKVCDTTTTAESLIHQILSDAGFTGSVSAFDISQSIPYFRIVNKDYFDVLSDLCFSYHASFYFDASGDFVMYDWGEASADISSTATLDEDNMLKSLSIDRGTDSPDTPVVEYYEQNQKGGVILNTTKPSVVITTAANVSTYDYGYWGGSMKLGNRGWMELANSKAIAASMSDLPPEYDGIISYSAKVSELSFMLIDPLSFVDPTAPGSGECYGPAVRRAFTFSVPSTYNNKLYWRCVSAVSSDIITYTFSDLSNDVSARIESIDSVGLVAVSEIAGTVAGDDIGPGTKTYKARYCYSSTVAEEVATALSENLKYGEYKYSWDSQENLTLGAYYTVSNDEANASSLVRITKKTTGYMPGNVTFYEYEAQRYSGFTSVVVSAVEGVFSTIPIITADEAIPPIDGPSLGDSTDWAPSETGLYVMSDKMGYYDYTASEWKAVINNDGTFKFDGDGSSYIEWDGSSLAIRGDLAINGNVIAGDSVQSENFETGVSGWQIDGNGAAEFETVVIREIDSSMLISGNLTVTGNLQLPAGYLYGLETEPGADTDHDVTINPGKCRGYNDDYDLVKTSSITKQIDAAWAAGTSEGGNFIGSVIGDSTIVAGGNSSDTIAFDSAGNLLATTGAADVNIHSGLTATVSSSITLGVAPAFITVDKDDNLITANGTTIYVYSGITNSLSTSFSLGYTISGISIDKDNNLLAYEINNPITIYDGISSTVLRTISTDIDAYRSLAATPWGTVFTVGQTLDLIVEYDLITGAKLNTFPAPGVNGYAVAYFNGAIVLKLNNSTTAYIYGQPWQGWTYHLFLIRKDSDGSVDAGWDTSIDCANIPTGYTAYRRIRSYTTDASANLVQTVQDGDNIDLVVPINNVNTASPGTSQNTATLSVPSGLTLMAKITFSVFNAGVGYAICSPLDTADTAPTITLHTVSTATSSNRASVFMNIKTSSSGQVGYRSSDGTLSDNLIITTHGYTDTRGRFGGK